MYLYCTVQTVQYSSALNDSFQTFVCCTALGFQFRLGSVLHCTLQYMERRCDCFSIHQGFQYCILCTHTSTVSMFGLGSTSVDLSCVAVELRSVLARAARQPLSSLNFHAVGISRILYLLRDMLRTLLAIRPLAFRAVRGQLVLRPVMHDPLRGR